MKYNPTPIVIASMAFAVWGFYTIKKSSDDKKDEKDQGETVKNAQKELKKAQEKDKPTYPDTQYTIMADTLFNAMLGGGTDEKKVYNVFLKLRNNTDLLKLITSFGLRKGAGEGATDENLAFWLHDDLNPEEIDVVNYILGKMKIVYRF